MPTQAGSPQGPASVGAPSAGTAFIVEDSIVQRRHAAELCRALGFATVLEAADGREALDLLDTLAQPPALMLVDLEMPRMDGVELLQELGRRSVGFPVVLVSARDGGLVESVQAMEHSVIASVAKPLTREALVAALRLRPLAQRPHAERRQPGRVRFDLPMLEAAIRRGEIVPHFQPKIDVDSAAVCGVEALARWRHDTLGWISPEQFVPAAEREGLIRPLTLSILDQAFGQAASWAADDLPISVAVNISPKLLDCAGIVGDLEALALRYAVPLERIILEVTEGSIVDTSGGAPAALARLRLKGFRLAIDDYGTGFSSLQQLARLPFTEMKIDRSFVHGAHARSSRQVILQSAIEMAARLGLVTVAEGVETIEDWRLLRQFGCAQLQGWLIARAMPGAAVAPWIRAEQTRLRDLHPTTTGTPTCR